MNSIRNVAAMFGILLSLTFAGSLSAADPDTDRDGVPDATDNCPTIPNTNQADSNHNGVGDVCEAAWANRDDDGDGVSNGIDNCPDEPNADQSNVCTMRAITVPAVPASPWIPHVTYSGATTTLKGIARYGGNQFMWSFGDGTSSTAWTAISNPYNLGVTHVYTGGVGQLFIATLSVRNSAIPSVVATAAYRLEIALGSNLADRDQTDVRARMAIDESLWNLHVNQTRSTFAEGAPGYRQAYGYWSASEQLGNCASLDALQLHGSVTSLPNNSDPYVEDVRRGLNYLLAQSVVQPITTQASGNPDTNGNGYGVTLVPATDIERVGLCALALADSGTPDRQALTGPANVYGRLHKEIVQETTDWFAFGQEDSNLYRGAWYYTANGGGGEMRLNTWPLLALRAAEVRMGAFTPPFVRSNVPYFNNYTRHTALDTLNGGWGLFSSNDGYVTLGPTGTGMLADEFLGDSPAHPELKAGLGFFYRNWAGTAGDCWHHPAPGNTYSMYPMAMALMGMQAGKVIEYNYNTNQQTSNSFDWYYTPAGQTQTGFAKDLITRQTTNGAWADTGGCGLLSATAVTALDTIILSKNPTAAPQAAICNCSATWAILSPVTFDGSCSTVTEPGRQIVNYEWDFNYNGTNFQPSLDANGLPITGTYGTKPDGFLIYTQQANGTLTGSTLPIALRVTDDTPANLGAPRTSIATCNVITKPANHCPHVDAGGPYFSAPGAAFQLDASGTFDVDSESITYGWDLYGTGAFNDSNSVKPVMVFQTAGTFVVAVRATDASQCSVTAYTTVEVSADTTPPPTPLAPLATATQRNSVLVLWNSADHSSVYELWRSQDAQPFSLLLRTRNTAFVDSVPPDKTSIYKVRAIGSGGSSVLGAPDVATSILFTDASLAGLQVKAVHLNQVRQAVAAMRVAAGLSATTFTDPTITAGTTPIKYAHVLELRYALDEARATIGVPALTYSDPSSPFVRAVHFLGLRAGTQ